MIVWFRKGHGEKWARGTYCKEDDKSGNEEVQLFWIWSLTAVYFVLRFALMGSVSQLLAVFTIENKMSLNWNHAWKYETVLAGDLSIKLYVSGYYSIQRLIFKVITRI